jgi:hypothetical protein
VRCGHRCTAEEAVRTAGEGAEHEDPRRRKVHTCWSHVGEQRFSVIRVGGGDGKDVGVVERGGVEGEEIDGDPFVSGGAHQEHIGIVCGLHGLFQSLGEWSHPGDVDDVSADVDGVSKCINGVGDVTEPGGVQRPQRHDANLPGHARHANSVVTDRPRDPRDVSAVVVLIHGIRIIVDEVPSEYVVHETVVVVIQTVVRDLQGIAPDVVRQIGMRVVHAGVHHGQDHVAAPGAHRPRRLGADVRARGSLRLPDVAQAPLFRKPRVVRESRGGDEVVRLRVGHQGMAAIAGQGRFGADAVAQGEVLDAAEQPSGLLDAEVVPESLPLERRGLVPELDQDLAGTVRRQYVACAARGRRVCRRSSQDQAGEQRQRCQRRQLSPATGACRHEHLPR